MGSPNKLAAEVCVVVFQNALAEQADLVLVVVKRVSPALAFSDGIHGFVTTHTKWTRVLSSSVEVDSSVTWHVGVRALQLRTICHIPVGKNFSVVEAIQVLGAVIRGKGPLSKPDIHVELFGLLGFVLSISAEVSNLIDVISESPVEVMVEDNVFQVVFVEELVPDVGVISETIVEDELSLWSVASNELADLSVELEEGVEWSVPPGLIDRLEATEG